MAHADDPAAWEAELARSGRVEVGYRRGRTMALGVVGVLFSLGGLLVAASADSGSDTVVGLFGAVFFGGVAVILLRRTARGGAAAVVTASGVGAPVHDWTVPWERAYGAFVFRQRGTAIVCIAVEPDYLADYLATAGRAKRMLAEGNRRLLGFEAMSLPTPLAVDADEFARWLSTKARARPPEPPAPEG